MECNKGRSFYSSHLFKRVERCSILYFFNLNIYIMQKFFNNIKIWSFGINNYSCNLECVTINPKDHSIEEVISSGIFINPFCDHSEEIYGLMGDRKNYETFVKEGVVTVSINESIRKLGFPDYGDKDSSKIFDQQVEIERAIIAKKINESTMYNDVKIS